MTTEKEGEWLDGRVRVGGINYYREGRRMVG